MKYRRIKLDEVKAKEGKVKDQVQKRTASKVEPGKLRGLKKNLKRVQRLRRLVISYQKPTGKAAEAAAAAAPAAPAAKPAK